MPDAIVPRLYDLTLKTYIGPKPGVWPAEKDWTFEGTQKMTIECIKATNKIIFHSNGLNINVDTLSITSTQDNGITVAKSFQYDSLRHFVTLTTNRNCQPGANYILHIDFNGSITPLLYGFYRSTYKINGVEK